MYFNIFHLKLFLRQFKLFMSGQNFYAMEYGMEMARRDGIKPIQMAQYQFTGM